MENEGQWVEYTIQYVYGSYSGTARVLLSPDEINFGTDPRDKMWGQLRRDGYLTLGMATKSAEIINSRAVAEG